MDQKFKGEIKFEIQKKNVTFALSLVGDRIPEVGNTYEQRRRYYVKVLTHRLVSYCMCQVL